MQLGLNAKFWIVTVFVATHPASVVVVVVDDADGDGVVLDVGVTLDEGVVLGEGVGLLVEPQAAKEKRRNKTIFASSGRAWAILANFCVVAPSHRRYRRASSFRPRLRHKYIWWVATKAYSSPVSAPGLAALQIPI